NITFFISALFPKYQISNQFSFFPQIFLNFPITLNLMGEDAPWETYSIFELSLEQNWK
ncbi:hypothetical protein LINGRAHAP2_LOCUS14638, partial [Linum grandiflorum]